MIKITTALRNKFLFVASGCSLQTVIQAPIKITTNAKKPMILFVTPGQLPNAKTPQSDAPNNWKAVVTGMARDEPTYSNALNVII
ncbi:Uncharacterised protein [Streptococcus pneumoniae]|nr:Uncharacterised protein [Streptococcus pneumoniae]CRG02552.1 Uncharacterised protein [Streptococcus pneumoniae]